MRTVNRLDGRQVNRTDPNNVICGHAHHPQTVSNLHWTELPTGVSYIYMCIFVYMYLYMCIYVYMCVYIFIDVDIMYICMYRNI